MKKIILWVLVGVLAVCVCVFGSIAVDDAINGNVKGDAVSLDIKPGTSAKAISTLLKNNNIIKFKFAFEAVAKLGGYDKNYKFGAITVEKGMGYKEIASLLTEPNRDAGLKITIPEGFEFRQIAQRLADAGLVDIDVFYAEAKKSNFDYKFLSDIPVRENELEGYLYPDTYFLNDNMSEHDILNLMLKTFDIKFKEEYYTRASELGMSVDEIVTLASIIERETSNDDERAMVSGVFHNRLKSTTMPYLQSCATVEYLLKERKSVLSVKDTKIDSPYNTYKYKGLPIGPIASPSIDSVEAALYPQEHEYLFFTLGKDGKHVFSKTYEEHLAATKEARK